MVDFDGAGSLLKTLDASVVALSVDDKDTTAGLAEGLQLRTLRMLHSADVAEVSSLTGAYTEEKRGILHATGFILAPGGKVAQACYSTGPIGRFTAIDTMRILRFVQQMRQRQG